MSNEQPTLARRSFGAHIRRLRQARGLLPREVAAAIGYKRDAIRRMENGEQGIKFPVAKALCEFFDVSGSEKSHLCELAVKSNERGWWEPYFDVGTGQGSRPRVPLFLETEQEAARIRVLEIEVIPGLGQTSEYLREVQTAQLIPDPAAEAWRALRTDRQNRLYGRHNPPQLEFLLGKSAIDYLDRMPGRIRDGQIRRLREVNAMPNAEVRVITAIHAGSAGSFNILTPGDGTAPFVFMDAADGCRYIEQPQVVSMFEQIFTSAGDRSVSLEEYVG